MGNVFITAEWSVGCNNKPVCKDCPLRGRAFPHVFPLNDKEQLAFGNILGQRTQVLIEAARRKLLTPEELAAENGFQLECNHPGTEFIVSGPVGVKTQRQYELEKQFVGPDDPNHFAWARRIPEGYKEIVGDPAGGMLIPRKYLYHPTNG